jgi:adenylate cyclase
MPGEKREVGLPQLIRLGTSRVLRLQAPAGTGRGPDASIVSLAGATLPPGIARSSSIKFPKPAPDDQLRPEEVVQWFATVVNVLQSDPATGQEYFDRAAAAVVDLVELDVGRVLFLDGEVWTERAVHVASRPLARPSRPFSQTLLEKVRKEKRTSWEAPAALALAPQSMLGLESVVAAPILDRDGEVLGALYGEREPRLASVPGGGGPITRLEAMLVELLAQGIAGGLARVEEERKAGKAVTLFEQFFGPTLARYLAQTPGWERSRQADVTLLFCDLKGFTRISRQLTAQQTYEWVADVLDVLSECVLNNGGVLVDYVGDEVMSMWGAPQSRPDHARCACQAALDMLAGLPAINERWKGVLGRIGETTDLAIGINSGTAQVGNVGSKFKFKYGAQGPTVNVASRVMNANKFFKTHVLLTRDTWEQPGVKDQFRARRLGAVRLNNVDQPLHLYEMVPEGRADWPGWRDGYERALEHFEKVIAEGPQRTLKDASDAEFGAAGRILASWRFDHHDDLAALVLLSRAVSAMVEGPAAGHPVWVFKEK